MTFHVGQKVVCVRRFTRVPDEEVIPVLGSVYTVRSLDHDERDGLALRLVEIVNKPRFYVEGVCECNFRASHFRPAVQPREELPESITKYLNVPGRVDA
jgi:hypothetical protein